MSMAGRKRAAEDAEAAMAAEDEDDDDEGSVGRLLPPCDDDEDDDVDDEAVEEEETAIAEANEFQEDKGNPIEGQKHRLYRTKDDATGLWVSSSVVTANFDSIVHRAARLGLFRRDAASQRDIDSSQFIREQAAAFRQEAIVDSTENRYDSQSRFECFVKSLGASDGGEHFAYLSKLEGLIARRERDEEVAPVEFEKPSMAVVDTWVRHMRNKRGNKAKSIETWVGGVSATCKMYHCPYNYAGQYTDTFKSWKLIDKELRAKPFCIAKDLPLLYKACFSKNGWNDAKRLEVWAALLLQLAIMGRASCVTTYCPLWEEMELPKTEDGFDADGLPKYLVFVMHNWKHRSGDMYPYKILVRRNYLDAKYCPIFWVLSLAKTRKFYGESLRGKIFTWQFPCGDKPKRYSERYRRAIKRLFIIASKEPGFEYLAECSSHSIRRSAALWANRSKIDRSMIMDIGRWNDLTTLFKYLVQGNAEIRAYQIENPNWEDPICRVWVCKTEVINRSIRQNNTA